MMLQKSMRLIDIVLWLIFIPSVSYAEVVTDGSVGVALELSGPDFRVGADLGIQAGNNLFHSFSQFNLAQGESAVFSGPDSIQHVIGRVTGGRASEIDGRIVSEFPNADLYLLNPAGLLFGAHAQLDVGGAFHALSAESMRFSDNHVLYVDPAQGSVFSSAPPAAFGFGDGAGNIALHGSQLSLPAGKSLTLAGGEINIDNGAQIALASGRINLNATAGAGELTLVSGAPTFSGTPGAVTVDNAKLQTSGESGGQVWIHAGQFIMDHESLIQTNTTGAGLGGGVDVTAENMDMQGGAQIVSSMMGSGQGSGIHLDVNGAVVLSGEGDNSEVTALVSRSLSTDGGEASTPGGIYIHAGDLSLRDGAAIESAVAGSGNGGDLVIETGSLRLSGLNRAGTGSFITTNTGGTGNGGLLRIQADEVILADGALLVAGTVSSGNGSPLELEIQGDLILRGADGDGDPSTIFTTTESRAVNAGDASRQNIVIRCGNFHLLDGGRIVTDTSGPGNGGKILINTGEFEMAGGAAISTNTFERGQAGIITIIADTMHISGNNRQNIGSAISSSSTGTGSGGTITLSVNELHLLDGAQVGTNTFDDGQGGSTEVKVSGTALFDGEDASGFVSGLFSATKSRESSAGNAGNITLHADNLIISNKAGVTAGTTGAGKGGNITLRADSLTMNNGAIITASSTRQGDAGKVSLEINGNLVMTDSNIETVTAYADGGDVELLGDANNLLIYLNNSNITTSVRAAAGNGGNILTLSEFIIQNQSKIIARAVSGDGGNINITTKAIFKFLPFSDSPIDASSQFGRDGEVQIQTPKTDVSSGLVVLSTQLNEDDDLQNAECTADAAAQASSFVHKPRQGVPTSGSRDYVPSY